MIINRLIKVIYLINFAPMQKIAFIINPFSSKGNYQPLLEELKNKTRVFHQRLKSTIESQLSLVNSPEWEDILRPTASYIQTSDEAFREVLVKVLDEEAPVEEKDLDYTLQLSEEEIAELTRQATAFEENETIALSIDEK